MSHDKTIFVITCHNMLLCFPFTVLRFATTAFVRMAISPAPPVGCQAFCNLDGSSADGFPRSPASRFLPDAGLWPDIIIGLWPDIIIGLRIYEVSTRAVA